MISVIVAIYNEEDYIPRCIESILQQTYTNLEILLIDDGSTDRSGEISDEYALQDGRCKVIHQKNSGIAGARNTGLHNVTGDFVMFVDGDDYIHPRFCEILRQALVETSCPIAIADAERVPDSFREVEPADASQCEQIVIDQDELMRRLFTQTRQHYTDLMVWGKLYRRELLSGVFFKDIIGEDIEYNSRILQKAPDGVFVDAKLYYWVLRHTSISVSNPRLSYRDIDGLNVWVACLHNLPKDATEYKSYALLRLYKDLLNRRYKVPNEYRSYVWTKTDRIFKDTIDDFKQNEHISIALKSIILSMYRMPFIYSTFMWIANKRHQLARLIRS